MAIFPLRKTPEPVPATSAAREALKKNAAAIADLQRRVAAAQAAATAEAADIKLTEIVKAQREARTERLVQAHIARKTGRVGEDPDAIETEIATAEPRERAQLAAAEAARRLAVGFQDEARALSQQLAPLLAEQMPLLRNYFRDDTAAKVQAVIDAWEAFRPVYDAMWVAVAAHDKLQKEMGAGPIFGALRFESLSVPLPNFPGLEGNAGLSAPSAVTVMRQAVDALNAVNNPA